ncbi:MAG: PAS domain-containing protein [candidate division KSB1 bacterium]|nr:PAS domain-containing protein [candidate division KSB1 bacterium]MDZ7401967.1 PAS domain-containing protein [candidate division KSB1 bacterium]
MKEIPQLQIDFAISVRESWYRSNFAQCDAVVMDISDGITSTRDMIRDIIGRCNGAKLVFLSPKGHLEETIGETGKYLTCLTKNPNFIDKLIALLKTEKNENRTEEQLLFALPEIEEKAPYLLPTIQAAFEPILIINKQMQVVAANEAFFKQFRKSSSKVLGKMCCEVLGDYFESCKKDELTCLIHEVIRSGSYLQTTKEGDDQIGKFSVRAGPIRNQQDEVEYAVLTLQKTAAVPSVIGQVFSNKSLLEQLLSGLSDGILFCNAEHRIIFSNLAAEMIIGKRRAELLNQSILDLPLGDGIQWLTEGLNNIRTGIRFNSIAFNALINKQKVQIRFAPIFGMGDYYLGGFLYLTEVEEFLAIETDPILQHGDNQNFEVLHLPSPRVIAEG